jgi:hypothetical protein
VTLHGRLRQYAATVVEKIDAISRSRELTDEESAVLEHFIKVADCTIPPRERGPYGMTRTLVGMGILRDMTIYRRVVPNKAAVARKGRPRRVGKA